jgi:hypothetical protein
VHAHRRPLLVRVQVDPIVRHARLQQPSVGEPHHHLEIRADVDRPVDHPGDEVLPGLVVGQDPQALGPHHRRRRTAADEVAFRPQLALAHPQPAAGPVAGHDLDVHHVGDAEEVGDEEGRGALVDLARRPHLVDPPFVHHCDPVAHAERLLLIVGDEDEGRPDLFLQRFQLHPQGAADLRVERPERLVEQQHRGPENQRPGERDALLLPARELVRPALRVVAQLDQRQRLLRPPLALLTRHLLVAHAEGDVVEHVQVGEEGVALEDRVDVAAVGRDGGEADPVEADVPRGRPLEAGDQAQRRRLAAAARAEQGEELPGGDLEVDRVDRDHVLEALLERFQPHLPALVPADRRGRRRCRRHLHQPIPPSPFPSGPCPSPPRCPPALPRSVCRTSAAPGKRRRPRPG